MKILKKVGIVFLILIVLSAIGNVIGGSKKDSSSNSAKTESKTESTIESTVESTSAESAAAQTAETAAAPAKSQRNGFDQAANQTYEYQGFAFSLPSYASMGSRRGRSVLLLKEIQLQVPLSSSRQQKRI